MVIRMNPVRFFFMHPNEKPMRVFRRFAGIALFLVAAMGAGAQAQLESKTTRPLLALENPNPRLGPVLEGKQIRHTVKIINKGQAPLKLIRLRPWRDTRVTRFDSTIPPGAKGLVELELVTLNAGKNALRGVTILTNEGRSTKHRLPIFLTVTPQIEASPDRVYLSGITGDKLQRSLRIHGNLKGPLKLSEMTSTLKDTIDIDLIEKTVGNYRLTVRNLPTAPGTIRGRIRFQTNYPKKPVLTVPVLLRILKPIESVPDRIEFGRIAKASYLGGSERAPEKKEVLRPPPRKSVFLRLHKEGTLKIERIVVDKSSSGFKIKVMPVETGRVYRIDVTVDLLNLPQEAITANLTIHTDDDRQAIIRIPLAIDVK